MSGGRCSSYASCSAGRSGTRTWPAACPESGRTSWPGGFATSRARASSRSGRLPPPAAANVYELTEYGEELREPLYALGRWGARSLGPPTAKDNLAPGWLVNAVRATCRGCTTDKVYELRVDDESVTARFVNRELVVESGTAPDADTVIETDPATLFCIASGQTSIGDAVETRSLKVTGDQAEAEQLPLAVQLRRPPARTVTRARARLRGARRSAPSSARRLR